MEFGGYSLSVILLVNSLFTTGELPRHNVRRSARGFSCTSGRNEKTVAKNPGKRNREANKKRERRWQKEKNDALKRRKKEERLAKRRQRRNEAARNLQSWRKINRTQAEAGISAAKDVNRLKTILSEVVDILKEGVRKNSNVIDIIYSREPSLKQPKKEPLNVKYWLDAAMGWKGLCVPSYGVGRWQLVKQGSKYTFVDREYPSVSLDVRGGFGRVLGFKGWSKGDWKFQESRVYAFLKQYDPSGQVFRSMEYVLGWMADEYPAKVPSHWGEYHKLYLKMRDGPRVVGTAPSGSSAVGAGSLSPSAEGSDESSSSTSPVVSTIGSRSNAGIASATVKVIGAHDGPSQKSGNRFSRLMKETSFMSPASTGRKLRWATIRAAAKVRKSGDKPNEGERSMFCPSRVQYVVERRANSLGLDKLVVTDTLSPVQVQPAAHMPAKVAQGVGETSAEKFYVDPITGVWREGVLDPIKWSLEILSKYFNEDSGD